jgi:hypothetical protein
MPRARSSAWRRSFMNGNNRKGLFYDLRASKKSSNSEKHLTLTNGMATHGAGDDSCLTSADVFAGTFRQRLTDRLGGLIALLDGGACGEELRSNLATAGDSGSDDRGKGTCARGSSSDESTMAPAMSYARSEVQAIMAGERSHISTRRVVSVCTDSPWSSEDFLRLKTLNPYSLMLNPDHPKPRKLP